MVLFVSALDIIAECDESWAAEIRMRQFQVHNAGWLEAVFGQGDEVNAVTY